MLLMTRRGPVLIHPIDFGSTLSRSRCRPREGFYQAFAMPEPTLYLIGSTSRAPMIRMKASVRGVSYQIAGQVL